MRRRMKPPRGKQGFRYAVLVLLLVLPLSELLAQITAPPRPTTCPSYQGPSLTRPAH